MNTQDMDLPPVARDFIRAANSRGLTLDIRPDEDGGVSIQIRSDERPGRALDLFFFRSATSGRWRNGHFRGIRNSREVTVRTVAEAQEFFQSI